MPAHVARKRFGQHFLVDSQVIAQIVEFIAVRRGDRVVEIGPGLGALTGPLLTKLDHLHVVEIDRDIVARLRQMYPAERLTVHAGDALTFDFGRLAGEGGDGLRLVGNLPYNISTPLLFHLVGFQARLRDMFFMLQREVVTRMVAKPGSGHYGRLSVMLQYRFAIDHLLDVPPLAFRPPPQVHSAVVRLVPRPEEALTAIDDTRFAALVARAFTQRRKMLRNSLEGVVEERRLRALDVALNARAEELSVADYVRLANALSD